MQQKRIRIAVIDDDRVFADALAGRLSDEPDLQVVGTVGSSVGALELISHNKVDVVALDLDLAGEDGLAVGRQLLERSPGLRIVVIAAAADPVRVAEAAQMGVRGWVAKQTAIDGLLSAVGGAARGEMYLPASLLTRALNSLSDRFATFTPEAEAIGLLAARELIVLRCLVEGMSRNEIATLLHISPHTVRTHIQSILNKLEVHSALTAVAFARRAGVLGFREEDVSPQDEVSPQDDVVRVRPQEGFIGQQLLVGSTLLMSSRGGRLA
jgi:DNA-binding NarL/FixJ family response regulator